MIINIGMAGPAGSMHDLHRRNFGNAMHRLRVSSLELESQ
jgi:hypothetical protein